MIVLAYKGGPVKKKEKGMPRTVTLPEFLIGKGGGVTVKGDYGKNITTASCRREGITEEREGTWPPAKIKDRGTQEKRTFPCQEATTS